MLGATGREGREKVKRERRERAKKDSRELNKKKREEEQKRKAEERAKKAAEKEAKRKLRRLLNWQLKQQKRLLSKPLKSPDKVMLVPVARGLLHVKSARDSTRQKAPKLSALDRIDPSTCCACFGLYEDDIGTGCE